MPRRRDLELGQDAARQRRTVGLVRVQRGSYTASWKNSARRTASVSVTATCRMRSSAVPSTAARWVTGW